MQTHPLPRLPAAVAALPVSVQRCRAAGCRLLAAQLRRGAQDQLVIHCDCPETFQRINSHGCCLSGAADFPQELQSLLFSLFLLDGFKFAFPCLKVCCQAYRYFSNLVNTPQNKQLEVISPSALKASFKLNQDKKNKILAKNSWGYSALKKIIGFVDLFHAATEDRSIQALLSSCSKFTRPLWHPGSTQAPETTAELATVTCCFSAHHRPSTEFLPVWPSLSPSLSLLVSLSGEVMWGTSYAPYLGRPVVLILPWLLDCQKEQAGRQSGLGECNAGWEGVPSQGTGGLGKLKALLTAGQWSGESGAWDIATLTIKEEKRKYILVLDENIWGILALLEWICDLHMNECATASRPIILFLWPTAHRQQYNSTSQPDLSWALHPCSHCSTNHVNLAWSQLSPRQVIFVSTHRSRS